VPNPIIERLRDRLTVNMPYEGVLADAYDSWISVDDELIEERAYTWLLDDVQGTILELGCGTGRPMLRWMERGYDIEGIDASSDMLDALRRHAAARGLDPVVHHGDIAPLDLGRTYAAIVCPAGTFTLIHDDELARAAVESWLAHLEPGGMLGLTAFVPLDEFDEQMHWRVRRTGTTADGRTIVVHEAIACDLERQVQVDLNRIETYDAEGRLLDTVLRRIHLRWRTQEQLAELLESVGFVDVAHLGAADGWVTTARRPS
jgi:SAM-dependent methyltransferase